MKTDFKDWGREALEAIARALADENEILKKDLKTALESWRNLLKQQQK